MLDTARARRYLKDFDLRTLFIEELGWDQHRQELTVPVDGLDFRLQAVAHKRGLVAFRCGPAPDGRIPPYALRRKIETQVAKSVNQHLIVYADADQTQQVWQWVKREAGRPAAAREQTFYRDQTGEALIQKLQAVAFSLEEEERLTLVDVAGRVRAGFDVERVTRRFYERFKAEHTGFLKFLRGIPDEAAQRWYASVMINRLMFIYFIQKKGFLDGDPDYLRTRLASSAAAAPGCYYADFLRPLFFQGFARREGDRSAETNRLLGQVPYLDGGLFQEHPVERAYGAAIQIADTAFERLFDFFDAYDWRLDERPLRADNEINPDVLGYIFEKYINQKQMGAYYTKEDITGYISQNTIIPYLLDAARRDCRVAFEGEHAVWRLLAADPDRYIYPALRHGAALPLPPEIAAGTLDVAQRTEWNRPAPAEYALPTEIWREVVARRQRYTEVKSNLQSPTSSLHSINDLITYNLDIRQFAQDVIAECEGPELLRAFWQAIESVTILDPTVGSGAFLFAALNVLEPLYEGCLERMQAFVDDYDRSSPRLAGEGLGVRSAKFSDFRKILARVAQHPNRRYFILKSIVVNNLYGVDIMEEAVEICKLRLFLKLVAQVARVEDVEPLPDIDFNVRAGNTLVGYATRGEVERALTSTATGQGKLMFAEETDALQRFEERAADVERLFGLFRQQQTELGGQVTAEDKAELRRRLDALDDELNRALAQEYGVEVSGDSKSQQPSRSRPSSANPQSAQADFAKVGAVSTADPAPTPYTRWLASHRPLHWFVEFYGIMRRGGFDVVIGNPPYVEYKDVKSVYSVRDFVTLPCGDLYAFVLEQAYTLASSHGWLGLIVPISVFGTDGFESLQRLSLRSLKVIWTSHFANRPAQLFDGAQKRLTVLLGQKGATSQPLIHTTGYLRWVREAREGLFPARLNYVTHRLSFRIFPASLEKIGSKLEMSAFDKLADFRPTLGVAVNDLAKYRVYYTRKFGYFLAFLDFVPQIVDKTSGQIRSPSELKDLGFNSSETMFCALAALSSSTFFWFWNVLSDCRNLNRRDLLAFPFSPQHCSDEIRSGLAKIGERYVAELTASSRMMRKGDLEIQTFEYATCKPIIDEIDRVLARHYGFTDEELDFIINYDIKYRMGDELEATDESG